MWLLKTASDTRPMLVSIPEHDLEPDDDNNGYVRVKYAIASHRWEADNEEVTFDEMLALSHPSLKENSLGYRKILKCCELARWHNLQYLWIDTCCIDKRSSAELQEAINSMFHWYERAYVCLIYLRDTSTDSLEATLASDQWFKRGWTLQELLAPVEACFYDKDWRLIGDKRSLVDTLSKITGISKNVLSGSEKISDCSIAQRMSWAWDRKTSRVEDIAYCLLGIFDVNMPLLYGERGKAFIRLQEELIRQSSDESIFAWYDKRKGFVEYRASILVDERWNNLQPCNQKAAAYIQEQVIRNSNVVDAATTVRSQDYRQLREDQPQLASNMLAKHPEGFRYASQIYATTLPARGLESFALTNRGLTTKTSLIPWSPKTYLLLLGCYTEGKGFNIGVLLRRLSRAGEYGRVQVAGEQLIEDERCIVSHLPTSPSEVVFVPRSVHHDWLQEEYVYGFHINIPGAKVKPPKINSHEWRWSWNEITSIVSVDPGYAIPANICDIYLDRPDVKIKMIRLGFDHRFVPFFIIGARLIKDDILTMNDEDRISHNSKSFYQSLYTSGTCLHSVEGQPGLWILRDDEVVGNKRSYHLFDKGNTNVAVATIELTRCFCAIMTGGLFGASSSFNSRALVVPNLREIQQQVMNVPLSLSRWWRLVCQTSTTGLSQNEAK